MTQPPLEYAGPEMPLKREIVSWRMVWLCARIGFFFTIIMGVVLPRMKRAYDELGFALPEPTLWLVRLRSATWDNLFGYGWVLMWAVLVAVPFVWPMVAPPRPREKGKRRKSLAWTLISLIFLLLAGLITVAAIMPMFSIIDAFQTSTEKTK